MLTQDQIAFYNENGYLHIPKIYSAEETQELSDEMDRLVADWAFTSPGWTGPWRQAYMDPETEKKSKLTAMHDLHFYSSAWARAVIHPKLVSSLCDLLGTNVELHHTTMHIKPPQNGHPFPMHQDNPFYGHMDGRYIDVLVHLDDTFHENGEIRFLADQYSLEQTVPVPAKAGDIVIFCIDTIHGSYINQTKKPRRLVRMGYRDPQNRQIYGQSFGRPGIMVSGYRERMEGEKPFSQEA